MIKLSQRQIKHGTHFCPEWDYALISAESPEFEACVCYAPQVKEGILHSAMMRIRIEWMTVIGCDVQEIINSFGVTQFPTSIVKELEQLNAALRLNGDAA